MLGGRSGDLPDLSFFLFLGLARAPTRKQSRKGPRHDLDLSRKSGKLLNSEESPGGCSGWGISEVVGLSVHAWSLTVAVTLVVIATIVVVVVFAASAASFSLDAA